MPSVVKDGKPARSRAYGFVAVVGLTLSSIAISGPRRRGERRRRERANLLVDPADDLGRVDPHPLLEHRAVDAAEVDRVAQVLAVQPVGRRERWVLGVEAALDQVADDPGPATGTVIGAAAVVLH